MPRPSLKHTISWLGHLCKDKNIALLHYTAFVQIIPTTSPCHLESLGRCQFLQEAHPLFVSSQVCTRPIRFFAMEYRSITEGENIDIGSPSAIATIRHTEVVYCDVRGPRQDP
jgi:hypothetical protein